MKRTIFNLPARAFIAAVAVAAGLAGAAHAQVLVMSEERILTESAVGQHIATEITRMRDEGAASLTTTSERLQAESEALSTETSALSEAALSQREDLRARFETLTMDSVELEVARAVLQQELMATQQSAMSPVLEALQAVLQEIVAERNATVLLDRSMVVYAGETVSITDAAIERLNQRLPTTAVNRVRVNDEQREAIRQQVIGQLVAQQRRAQQMPGQQ